MLRKSREFASGYGSKKVNQRIPCALVFEKTSFNFQSQVIRALTKAGADRYRIASRDSRAGRKSVKAPGGLLFLRDRIFRRVCKLNTGNFARRFGFRKRGIVRILIFWFHLLRSWIHIAEKSGHDRLDHSQMRAISALCLLIKAFSFLPANVTSLAFISRP